MTKQRGKKYLKSGEKAKVSGQYGEPLPPTPKKGQKYILVDPTKHKK